MKGLNNEDRLETPEQYFGEAFMVSRMRETLAKENIIKAVGSHLIDMYI